MIKLFLTCNEELWFDNGYNRLTRINGINLKKSRMSDSFIIDFVLVLASL